LTSRIVRNSVVLVVLAVFGLAVLWTFMGSGDTAPEYGYGQLIEDARAGNIDSITKEGLRLTATFPNGGEDRTAIAPSELTDPYNDICAAAGPDSQACQNFNVVEESAAGGVLTLLITALLPVLLIGGFIFFMMRQAQGTNNQAMSFGKSRARMFLGNKTVVTFNDVAGVDEAKQELTEVVEFLKYPEKFNSLGARIPRGVLLVGPPGTGKTLLARAVAGEAGVPFFSISGSEFVEMFVGVGASRVRDLFEQAKRNSPCIVFVDEIDAVGRQRGAGLGGSHDEREQTLNQILVEMDGFDTNTNVIVVAATNRPEILDPALLRAGRFDRQVLVDRPDQAGRLAILKVHAGKIILDDDVDLSKVAGLTTGFTGADLANLINEAAIAATRRDGASVTFGDFTTAIERIVAGIEKKSRVLSEGERRRVAYHEMGHGLVAANLPGVDPVQKVSIIPRGVGALGYTMQRPTEDRFLLAASELKNRIVVLMGGRAAEDLIFDGDVSTGAADDLQKATDIAIEMVTRYGMDSGLGERTYTRPAQAFLAVPQTRAFEASQATEREIDLAVREIVEAARVRAKDILAGQRSDLDAGAEMLLTRETLTAEEFAPLQRGQHLSGHLTAGAAGEWR